VPDHVTLKFQVSRCVIVQLSLSLMPYLFQKCPVLHSGIAIDDSCKDTDTVLLPNDLWDTLSFYGEPQGDHLAVTFSRATVVVNTHTFSDQLACWCIRSVCTACIAL
jgi:hypothetical protein